MTEYDCVIVGGRCAGASLARFLARAGARVLVLEAGTMPSDQPMSTHFIQPYGMRILDELGLGDRVREIAPPVSRFVNGLDGTHAVIELSFGGCCPRRTDLDALLLEGAREAGAEVRLKARVVDVVREGDRVVGVVVEHDERREEIRGRVVVGADGQHSTIATKVGAEEYYGYEGPRAAYWAYWPRPTWYREDPRYLGSAFIVYDGLQYRFVFPTNHDQLLIGVAFPREQLGEWKGAHEAKLIAELAEHSVTGPLIEGAQPISKTIGIVKARFFFKQAAGKGWALVGDAGLFKDPAPGLGISDALRDARALSQAILAGDDAALERYWRQRDVESVELFHFAKDLGDVRYNNPLNRMVVGKLVARPELTGRIRDVIERRTSPFAAFSVGEVVRWTFGALVRGRFGVLGPFFRAGKYGGMVKRELAHRKRLAMALPKSAIGQLNASNTASA